jgi:hypothetical protein
MAIQAQRYQIAFMMCAAVAQRDDVMHRQVLGGIALDAPAVALLDSLPHVTVEL